MRHFCPSVEPGGRVPPRGGTGSRQCLCWTPSSTLSSRDHPTLRSQEAWSSSPNFGNRCPSWVILDRIGLSARAIGGAPIELLFRLALTPPAPPRAPRRPRCSDLPRAHLLD